MGVGTAATPKQHSSVVQEGRRKSSVASHCAGGGRRGSGGRRLVSNGAMHAKKSIGEAQQGAASAEPNGTCGFMAAVGTPAVDNPNSADGGSVEVVDDDGEHRGRDGVPDISQRLR